MSRKRKNTTRATPAAARPSQGVFSQAAPNSTPRTWKLLHLTLLILLSLTLYAPTLRNGFVTDDRLQILQNSLVLEAKNLGLAFTGDVWAFARSAKESAVHGTNYYRPLQPLLYTAEFHLWGTNPLPWHLFNTLLNAAVVAMVYLLVAALGTSSLAFWSALLFALHPMHCEPVAWIAALPELLCALFLLLAMWFYRRSESSPVSVRHLLLGAFFFLCALLSKEPALLFPVILVCYELAYRPPLLADLRKLVLRLLPYLVVLSIYLVARISALGGFSPRQIMDHPRLSLLELFFAVPALFARYVGKLLLPARMNYFYAFPLTSNFTVWAFAGFVAGLLLVAAALFFRKGQPILAFALCWFLFTLLPALSVNSIALNFFNERYLYIPSVGFAVVAASAGLLAYSRIASAPVRTALATAFAAVFLFYSVQIERRLPVFHDNYTLLSDTVRKSPNSYLAQGQYAAALYDDHDLDGALEHVLLALQLNPDYILGHLNAAMYLADKGQYDVSISQFKEAIRLYPDSVVSWENLAHAYAMKKDWKATADAYRHAASLDSAHSAYFLQFASIADVNAESQAALSSLRSAVDTNPRDFSAWAGLGDAFGRANQWPQAAEAYEHAAGLQPTNAAVFDKWGVSLLRIGESARAAEVLRHAVLAEPDSLYIRQVLASALAASGHLSDSNAQLHKILEMSPSWEHADQVHFALGENLEKSGDPEAAVQEYQHALALNSSLQAAAQRLAALRPH